MNQDRIRNKIAKIKKALAEDKKFWRGFYHDGKGLRYNQPGLYLKLNDYNGASNYFRWFDKNFPKDSCFPTFLFEWTLTLFKIGKFVEAEKKALQTFISNPILFDKFFERQILKININENFINEDYLNFEDFDYSKDRAELCDFVDWLAHFLSTDKFTKFANEFIKFEIQLQSEKVVQKRGKLINKIQHLFDNFDK